MEDVTIVIAIAGVDTEILHSLGTTGGGGTNIMFWIMNSCYQLFQNCSKAYSVWVRY